MKIILEYTIFNENIEKSKLTKCDITTPYIIKHENYLPILKGEILIFQIFHLIQLNYFLILTHI